MEKQFQIEIEASFLEIIQQGADLNAMCKKAAEILKLPVAITITTRTIIARSPDYSQDLVEEYSNHFKFSSQEEIQTRIHYIDHLLAQKRAFMGSFPLMRYPHINCGCFFESNLLGVLDIPVIFPIEDPSEILETVEFMAPIFLLALRLNKYVSVDMKFSMQVYFAGLLNSTSEEWIHTNRLYDSELAIIKEWQLIYIPTVYDKISISKRFEAISRYCAECDHVWPIEYKKNIVILKKADAYIDHDHLFSLASPVQHIVISEAFSNLKLIKNHLHACERTYDIANFVETDETVVFVHNYKIPICYLVLKQHPNGMTLAHPAIEQIKKYDTANNTNYYLTLKTYLLTESNYQKTADKLFVHKNTVMYRIQRIEELFDLNLRDCRISSALYLSLFDDYVRS